MGHKPGQDLLQELEKANLKVKTGDRFSHYKHPENFYIVLAIGFIEATEELSIIYQAEYGDKFVWIRTFDQFFSKAKLENGEEVDRFTKVLIL